MSRFAPFRFASLKAIEQRVHAHIIAHHQAQKTYGKQAMADEEGEIINHIGAFAIQEPKDRRLSGT